MISSNILLPYESSAVPEIFQTPVQIRVKPESSPMPQGYPATIDTVVAGTYFRDVYVEFSLDSWYRPYQSSRADE
jgi:hypothetical protein